MDSIIVLTFYHFTSFPDPGEIRVPLEILCKKNPQISKIVFLKFFTEICNQANNYS